MTRDPAHRKGIFVVHFALHEPFAEIGVVFGRRNLWPKLLGRAIHRVLHPQTRKDLLRGERIQGFAREPLGDFLEQDDAEVRIDHLRAGLILERLNENLVQRVLFALGRAPVLFERRQTGSVRQQVPQGHLTAPLLLRTGLPLRQEPLDGRVEIQWNWKITFGEPRRQRRRADNLAQRGEVVDRMRLDRRSIGIVAEFSKRTHGELPLITDRQDPSRKRFILHRAADGVPRRLKFLLFGSVHRAQGHRVRRQRDTVSRPQLCVRDADRKPAGDRNLAE